jgi:hypothetical protein
MYQTIQQTPLFACAIGSGAPTLPIPSGSSTSSLPLPSANSTGNGPSPDSWARLEAIMKVASRTGHSSFYVEKGRQVLGKSANELGKFGLRYSLGRLSPSTLAHHPHRNASHGDPQGSYLISGGSLVVCLNNPRYRWPDNLPMRQMSRSS